MNNRPTDPVDQLSDPEATISRWRTESIGDFQWPAEAKPACEENRWPDDQSNRAASYFLSRGLGLPWGYDDEFGEEGSRLAGLRAGSSGVVLIVESSRKADKKTYAAKTLNSFLRPDYLDLPHHVQEKLCTAFLEEALPWLEMGQHPHIVPVQLLENILHPELKRKVPFIFSEFMPLGSLRNYIEEKGNLSIEEALALGIQLCDGLLHAYSFNLEAHRDIKPENILVHEKNLYKITDFSANVIGTPGYMAPEQVAAWWQQKEDSLTSDDLPVDNSADQFAIGLVMLEAHLGFSPIAACSDSCTDRNRAKLFIEERSPEIDDLQVPELFKNIITRLLSPLPGDRYPDQHCLRKELVFVYKKDFGTYEVPEVIADDSADWWYGRGLAFDLLGRPASAEAAFKDALERYWSTPGTELSQARCQLNLGKVNRAMGLYNEAEKAVNIARKVFSGQKKNRLDLAECLMILGAIFGDSGRYQEAEKVYDEAMEILESIPGSENRQNKCISNRGIIYCHTDRFNDAEQAFRESLRLCQQIPGSELDQAKALVNLGNVYDTKGLVSKAIESFDEGMEILYHIPATEWLRATCKMNIGNALNQIGRYSEALKAFDEAKSVYDQIPGTELDQANCAMNLGIVYTNEGRNEEARKSINEALIIYGDFPGTELEQAKCLESLGSIYCDEGNFKEAKKKTIEALEIFHKIPGTEHFQAICTVGLATIYRKTGDLDKAEIACNEAKDIYNEIPETEFYQAACAAELALIHREKKDLPLARQFAREAINLCKFFPLDATVNIRAISREILGEEGEQR